MVNFDIYIDFRYQRLISLFLNGSYTYNSQWRWRSLACCNRCKVHLIFQLISQFNTVSYTVSPLMDWVWSLNETEALIWVCEPQTRGRSCVRVAIPCAEDQTFVPFWNSAHPKAAGRLHVSPEPWRRHAVSAEHANWRWQSHKSRLDGGFETLWATLCPICLQTPGDRTKNKDTLFLRLC